MLFNLAHLGCVASASAPTDDDRGTVSVPTVDVGKMTRILGDCQNADNIGCAAICNPRQGRGFVSRERTDLPQSDSTRSGAPPPKQKEPPGGDGGSFN